MDYYIVEHETKGVLTDMPHERDEKPHFAWSVLRSSERARRFTTVADALNALAVLPEGCYVLFSDGWARTTDSSR